MFVKQCEMVAQGDVYQTESILGMALQEGPGSESEEEEAEQQDDTEDAGAPGGSGRGVLAPGRKRKSKHHVADKDNKVSKKPQLNSKGKKGNSGGQGKDKKQQGTACVRIAGKGSLPRGAVRSRNVPSSVSKESKRTGTKSKRR
jgi:hypothetical protein